MISLVMMKRFSSLRKLISRLLLVWLYHWDWHRNDREKEKCRDSDDESTVSTAEEWRRRRRGKISPKKDLIVFFNFLSFSLSIALSLSHCQPTIWSIFSGTDQASQARHKSVFDMCENTFQISVGLSKFTFIFSDQKVNAAANDQSDLHVRR